MPLASLADLATTVVGRDALLDRPVPAVLVDLCGADPARALPAALPLVCIGVGSSSRGAVDAVDVVADDDEAVGRLLAAVEAAPLAATALALLLRGGGSRSIPEGLVAESATYSALQAGPEHQAWLRHAARPSRRREAGDPVEVARDGSVVRITLHRPDVRNALDVRMREALLDALATAQADPSLQVELRGSGPSFCSGGDLTEFGSLRDPASGHVVRLGRSVALALSELADRTTAFVHGASAGAGVELPAFAGRVVATAGARFSLPELSLGLVPGAGGTVSLPRRIGRHRTAWLALTGAAVDADTALRWGLVDEVRPSG